MNIKKNIIVKNRGRQHSLLFIFLFLVFVAQVALIINVRSEEGGYLPLDNSNNHSFENAQTVYANIWYVNCTQEQENWYKLTLEKDGFVNVFLITDTGLDEINVEIYNASQALLNRSNVYDNVIKVSSHFAKDEVAYIKVSGDNVNTTYQILFNVFTTGDNMGFYISDDYRAAGYTPNKVNLMAAYLLMAATIMLYLQFGYSFISKGIHSENTAQSSYYKGLGGFIISVALSESTYVFDLLSRDLRDQRFFLKVNLYPDPFDSLIEADYYVASFFLLLFAMTFLIYPMEKYLYAHKRKVFTISVAIGTPFPLILRYLEINHKNLGFDLERGSFEYQMFSLAWIVLIFLTTLSFLYLLKLYIDLGRKAPKGSKLKKKSQQIVWGIIIWTLAIFTTGSIIKEISKVDSIYAPWSHPLPNTYQYFIWQLRIWYLLPILPPLILLLSLGLLSSGFTRDY